MRSQKTGAGSQGGRLWRAAGLFCPLLLVSAGCLRKQAGPVKAAEAPPVEAAVLKVKAEPFAAVVAVTGTLVSSARVDVKAETTGKLVKFPKQEGDAVAAGEAIAWVDETNYHLALRQAESSAQVAEAALERARVMETHSQAELERARNLVKSGGITDRDLKAAELAAKDSTAQVSVAKAQLDQAAASVEVARKRLDDTVIRAPVSGVIQRKFINPGAYVEPPTAVFTIVDNGRLELESPVPSSQIAAIRPGQKTTFTVNAYPGVSFEGRVIEISPEVEAQTRAAKVRVRVDNSGGKLKAGMFAQGEILTGVAGEAIVIPAAAVYRDDRSAKESFVYVVVSGKALRRPVRIGRETDSRLEIVAGLKADDLLIAEQSVELADGVTVKPRM